MDLLGHHWNLWEEIALENGHVADRSSKATDSTDVENLMNGLNSNLSVNRLKYSSNSGCVEKCCGQSSRWANE